MADLEPVRGPVGAALLAFEQMAVAAEAIRVREAGERTTTDVAELVTALEEASAAAAGVQLGSGGGLLTGAALAECASLLARRAHHLTGETDEIAESMFRSVAVLAAEDEAVSRSVSRAAG